MVLWGLTSLLHWRWELDSCDGLQIGKSTHNRQFSRKSYPEWSVILLTLRQQLLAPLVMGSARILYFVYPIRLCWSWYSGSRFQRYENVEAWIRIGRWSNIQFFLAIRTAERGAACRWSRWGFRFLWGTTTSQKLNFISIAILGSLNLPNSIQVLGVVIPVWNLLFMNLLSDLS